MTTKNNDNNNTDYNFKISSPIDKLLLPDYNKETDGLEFNRDKKSGVLRCKGCNNSIFSIYRGEVYYSKIDKFAFEEVAECCECLSSTVVTHLRETYDEDENS